jgi:hypothetical protein
LENAGEKGILRVCCKKNRFSAGRRTKKVLPNALWSNCKEHDAMAWQRHFKRHAKPQLGRNCVFEG